MTLDRLVAAVRSAPDTTHQRRLWREIVRFQTEQLPILPMFFNLSITIFREGVTGVKEMRSRQSGPHGTSPSGTFDSSGGSRIPGLRAMGQFLLYCGQWL